METITHKGMNFTNRHTMLAVLMVAIAVGLMAVNVSAGTGGTEFDGIWTLIEGWMKGTLGRIIAGGCVLTGLIAGWAKGSLWAAVTGIGMGLCLYYAPAVINSVVSAVV